MRLINWRPLMLVLTMLKRNRKESRILQSSGLRVGVYVETFSDKRDWVRAVLSIKALWELIVIYIIEIVYIQDRTSINNQHATYK